MIEIALFNHTRCKLGEGPVWDPAANCLYWIDGYAPAIHCQQFDTGRTRSWPLPGTIIGSLAVRQSGGLVLAMDHGFYAFDTATGQTRLIAEPLAGQPHMRFNDGKVDPHGAFIAGAMNIDPRGKRPCPVFRLSPDGSVHEIMTDFLIFNGPCFNAAGDTLYVTGRIDHTIEAVDYSGDGTCSNARVCLPDACPDGATVDADDHIWSAQWTDGCILRLTPDGHIAGRIDIPGQIVTSVMFGGPDLDLLFVTTLGASFGNARASGPDAGKTLVIKNTGATGRPEPEFRG